METMTTPRVELPEREATNRLDPAPTNTTRTRLDANTERVLPIVAVLYEQAQRRADEQLMIQGYREMGAEMLDVTRSARQAQLRALPSE